jgi:hypothetical protein
MGHLQVNALGPGVAAQNEARQQNAATKKRSPKMSFHFSSPCLLI